jgi:subtilase family serine protease
MIVAIAGAASLLALSLGAAGGVAAAGPGLGAGARDLRSSQASVPDAQLVHAGTKPPTDAQCRAATGMPCYSPQEIRRAYGVNQLLQRGDDGKGETIVIFDSFGSPTIASDLAHFDAGYGLPAPPSFKILAPLGTAHSLAWAGEVTLDVEWAHAMAPDASIVLMTSPVNETEGVHGMPQFNALENYALDHHLGQVFSQSWGATENTLFTPAGRPIFGEFEATYARAAATGVTVLASTGDSGSAGYKTLKTFYPFPAVEFPASSPLVTAVGGTRLTASTKGVYQSEKVWNSDGGAGGGGISQFFKEPSYQKSLPAATQKKLGGHRGIPDISWNADPNTPVLIYMSAKVAGQAGYYGVGGTSEGSPDWAGLVADLDQATGHPLGLLNTTLYTLGKAGSAFHDVTVGNNGLNGVKGYSAAKGWDLASGFGSPNVNALVGAVLAKAGALRH